MKIIGWKNSTGEYEGRQYNNVILHGTRPIEGTKGSGDETDKVKVKRSLIEEVWKIDLNKLIGQNIEFTYDRFGNVNGYVKSEN